MMLPNADRAVIAQSKVRDYLLNVEHKRGGSKARLLASMGYNSSNWQRLADDIRQNHVGAEVVETVETEYGPQYTIVAPITGPVGRTVMFRSVWQVDLGTDFPRLITMYPE